jgi:hypothetical protein
MASALCEKSDEVGSMVDRSDMISAISLCAATRLAGEIHGVIATPCSATLTFGSARIALQAKGPPGEKYRLRDAEAPLTSR